jgi:hypothetical protein
MKNLTAIFLLFPFLALAQVKVFVETDPMSGETYTYSDRVFLVVNQEKTKGFKVDNVLNNDLTLRALYVTMYGIGSCNENDEIIILFESGDKIIKKSFASFNCEGEAFFKFTDNEIGLLRKHPMSKIRMTNGSTFDSFTGDVRPEDKTYFIQLFNLLDNKKVIVKN